MNRVLKIVGATLLVTYLTTAVLAVTVFRPHSEVFPLTFEEHTDQGIPMRSSLQVTRHWKLHPLSEWRFGPAISNCWGPAPSHGWQCGPFAFAEIHQRHSWPLVVEKAASVLAAKKLHVKEFSLSIQNNDSISQSWRVVASAPGGPSLTMNLDSHGNLLSKK